MAATLGVALSRVSGIVRAQVVNGVFGAGVALDAYNVAMRFPTVLRDLFAEGALSAAFTKTLVQAREGALRGGEVLPGSAEAERAVTALVVGAFGIATVFIAVVCVFIAEPLVSAVTAQSFAGAGGQALARDCFRVLAFYLPVAMLSAVAMALLGARGQTFRATIASLFFNVGSVGGALFGAPAAALLGFHPILGLAVGTLVGGVLQFLYQLVPLWREGVLRLPRLADLRWKGSPHARLFERHPLTEITLLMLPRLVGQGALSIALFINTHFATAAGPGAITYITNAQNIILVPVGLFGVASAFASLPLLTRAVADRDSTRLSGLLRESLRGTLWLSSFSVVCLALFCVPLSKALLEHGRVTPQDSLMNGLAVGAYCFSILFNGLSKVTVQGYYALGDTRRLMANAGCYLAVNATLSALLAPRLGILGLGLSNVAASAVDLGLNLAFLPRVARAKGFSIFEFAREKGFYGELLVHVGVCATAVTVSLVYLRPFFTSLTAAGTWFTAWTALGLTVVGGAFLGVLWGAAVWWRGPDQLRGLLRGLLRKLRT